MRCLILHCKSFAYALDHPTSVAEEANPNDPKQFVNCLVVFASAEMQDSNITAESASIEVAKIAKLVKAESVLLNPFAHLSNSLAKPKQAIQVLKTMAGQLASQGIQVYYSPFGWYKEFSFDVLAHNSSQLFRSF
jgi:threonyl-tRNA synthetase